MIYLQLCQLPVQILCVLAAVCFKESFSIEGKYTKNVNSYKIVYPVKVTVPDESSKRYRRWDNDGEESTVHYQLNLGGNEECIVDLEPNLHILSPGAVLEHRTISIDNEPLANVQLKQPSYTQCFFKGKVRNYEDSSTALSTCGGLCGYIRVKRRTFFIEPVVRLENKTEQEQAHLLYEDDQTDITAFNCASKLTSDANENNPVNVAVRKNIVQNENTDNSTNSTSSNKRLHIETLLVLDQSMMDLHDASDLKNYALTVFNMAQSLFHDLSIDPPIDLEIVRIIEVEDPKDILNFRQKRYLGTDELETFSTWQLRINPKDEGHPNHHDLAVLLTGSDICDKEGSCHYVGLAKVNGACRPKRQAAICKDTGLMLGYVIAHQIAHTLGVGHDPAEKTAEGISSVMSPIITLSPKVWSEESRSALLSAVQYVLANDGKRHLDCLEDEPASEFKVFDILPGVMYDADYQCQQLLTPDARSCSKKGDCQNLACEFDGTTCSNTGIMPAPGTSCDKNKWCFEGACLEAGQRPRAVEGNWGAWSEWSPCSRTCGAGVSVSTRECDSPAPMYGGKSCSGSRNRHKICTTEPCGVESLPFRDVQCAEYNDWVFPEDGQLHKWKGFIVSNGNPCALYCRNDKGIIVSLSPKVKDGTTCYRGMRDICVDGICRDIPCDLQFDSNSVEDACGICHGNGTACQIVQGKKFFQEGTSQILTIPAGTRNIVVEENNHTPSHLFLKAQEKDEIINEGNKLGMFNVSGSMGWLGMIKPNQEILEIPGPLMKPVELWITSEGPQSVTYSMGLPTEPRLGKYSWDYLDWSACMAQCGDSYQESIPKCIELMSGHVEDKYCSQIQKPPVKRRSCNAGFCLPRWLVGEWQECGPCPSNEARRFRIVRCIKPIAGSEDGMTIVGDIVCPGSRPIGSEPCRCIKRQVLYWPSPYKFDRLSNNFKILPKIKNGNKTSKTPEKKVTLMQLENENEESMLKQFKENQQKHHSIFYMPPVLGSRFNFSIPFKKREAIINRITNQNSLHLFNDNLIDYFPKLDVIDVIKTGNRIMGNNYAQTTPSTKLFTLTEPGENIYSMKFKRLRPISTNDPPPLIFSDQNILKLLSDNLPLEKLKQQHNMNRNNKDPFNNFIYFPEIYLNDTGFSQPKQEKKLDMIEILMNEFNNVLATNALTQPNTKNPVTTESDIVPMHKMAVSKSRDSVLENEIQVSRQPFFPYNTSGLDAAISKLQNSKSASEIMNTTNGLINLKVNNQKASENWIPLNDPEWNKLLKAFRQYFLQKQYEAQRKSASKTIDDPLSKNEEDEFFASTYASTSNVTNDNLQPLRSLTRKVTEELNNLSNRDKFKAYQFFSTLVKNLHHTLSAFSQNEHSVNKEFLDVKTPIGMPLIPMRDNIFGTDLKREKTLDFFNHINEDLLRFNRSNNSVFNYSLPKFDKPIFSAEDLAKIKEMFQSGGTSVLFDTINVNENPEFYQLLRRNKPKAPLEETSEGKSRTTNGTEIIPEATTKGVINHYLDEFIADFFSDLHKGRNKKEAIQKLKQHPTGRIGRYIQECTKAVALNRRITGIYSIPVERICPRKTTSAHPRFYLQRCRKNIANAPGEKNEKTADKSSFEKRIFSLPGNIKMIRVFGRKRRHKPCEESTRVCEELKRRFKDRLANHTKLDPYQCQRLREEIQHVKHNLNSELRLENDLKKIMDSNATCIFLYRDEVDTTTPLFRLN